MNALTAWFQQKTLQEQKIIVIIAVLSSLLLLYAFLYLPATREYKTLQARISDYQNDVSTMQSMAAQIKSLTTANNGNRKNKKPLNNSSLMTLIEKTAKQQSLTITQIKPLSKRRVHIVLNATVFNDVMRWLYSLQKTYPIKINKINTQANKAQVNLQLTLSY